MKRRKEWEEGEERGGRGGRGKVLPGETERQVVVKMGRSKGREEYRCEENF